MESLARRGVRTTVAVAGLAALGVGLAAPAFASPNVPDVRGIGNGPAGQADQPAATSSGFTQASDALAALPGLFDFQPPTAEQQPAAPDATPADASAASESAQTADAPESSGPARSSGSTDATPPASAAPTSPLQSLPVGVPQVQAGPVSNPASALQALDAAGIF